LRGEADVGFDKPLRQALEDVLAGRTAVGRA